MKSKKKKPLTSSKMGARRKGSKNSKTKKPVPVNRNNKKTALKKKARGTLKPAIRETKKKVIIPSLKYYITISGKRISLDNEIIRKYNLKAGDYLPFSRHKVFIEK